MAGGAFVLHTGVANRVHNSSNKLSLRFLAVITTHLQKRQKTRKTNFANIIAHLNAYMKDIERYNMI